MAKSLSTKKRTKTKMQEMHFGLPKGFFDILPQEQPWWERVDKVITDLAEFYNFRRVETPVVESADLFEKAYGEGGGASEDLYVLKTKGGRGLALRPEGMLPVLRSYLERGLGKVNQPQKLFYRGQVFSRTDPSGGGQRQFFRAGFEIIGGSDDPIYDAQTVLIFDRLLDNLKLKGASLRVNSVGCRVCRPGYRRLLQNYYRHYLDDLCANCRSNFNVDPMFLLACKVGSCEEFKKKTPNILDKICVACSRQFKTALEYLDELEISYLLDPQLVGAQNYFNQTIFEFSSGEDRTSILIHGGRHDYLGELISGKAALAVGGEVDLGKLVSLMRAQEVKLPARGARSVFMVHVGELAKRKSLKIVEDLRSSGIQMIEALGKESIKSQLKIAGRGGSQLALIFGQKEVYEESIIIRDLRTGLQETVILSKIVPEIQRRFREKQVIGEK